VADAPFRILPRVVSENEFFWTSGADGQLRFLRCDDDGTYIHPPQPRCPKCLGKSLTPAVVSGRATVHAFTVNHHPWIPGFDPPYVIAIVEIEEQADVRLTTNIVNCPVDDVHVGLPVRVVFEQHDDTYLPLFEPDGTRT
jgi:uncharacterized OB-fold protein